MIKFDIFVKGRININRAWAWAAAVQADERNKGVIFKNYTEFIDCISEINIIQVDNANDLNVAMPMYSLIEYSDNYLERSGSLWKYYIDKSIAAIVNSESSKSKLKITGKTPANSNTKDVEIAVPLKYQRNFCRTLEMPLIKCEVNLILTWSAYCVISSGTGTTKFDTTDTKLYVPLVTSSTEDNAKLLQQLKSLFKRTSNWNKYQSKVSVETSNQYLDWLIDPSFQGANRLFVLPFENSTGRAASKEYYLPKVEIKD